MFSQLSTILFVLLLVVVVPILSYRTAHSEHIRQVPRLALYTSAVLSQWLLAGIGLLIGLGHSRGHLAGFYRPLRLSVVADWSVFLVLVSLAGTGLGLLLERWGLWPKESDLVYLLIPQTRREKLWSVLLVAPTAALCEEFLYRGYLLAILAGWFHSAAWGLGVSSVVFGLAHAYQGWSGMLRAALLGALLAWPVVRFGSLFPSMLAHGLIDALALVWLGPRFLPPKSESTPGGL